MYGYISGLELVLQHAMLTVVLVLLIDFFLLSRVVIFLLNTQFKKEKKEKKESTRLFFLFRFYVSPRLRFSLYRVHHIWYQKLLKDCPL